MTITADGIDVRRYTQEYERLRCQVNGVSAEQSFATPLVRGVGLALLLRDGLPAWMRAVQQVLSEAVASAAGNDGAAPSHCRLPPAPAPSGDGSGVSISSSSLVEPARQRDVTTLLASLVLSARRTTTDAASMKEPSPCH